MDIPYKNQLSSKQRNIIKLLGKYCRIEKIVPMDSPFHYRCKVSSAFGFSRGKAIHGIWQSSSGKIVQTQSCALEDERAGKIIDTINRLLPIYKLTTYNEITRKGFLRFVTVRIGKNTGEILVALGTGSGAFPTKKDFAPAV